MVTVTAAGHAMPMTNYRLGMLQADFAGMENLEEVVQSVWRRLTIQNASQISQAYNGLASLDDVDATMAEMVRKELGKTLGIIRANLKRAAIDAGAGDAAASIRRRSYKNEIGGNVNISSRGNRVLSPRRPYPTYRGKTSLKRDRSIKGRTQQLATYGEKDRQFVLNVFNAGRDTFMATPEGPTGRGSRATYGNRKALAPRPFMNESVVQQQMAPLGQSIIRGAERIVESAIKNQH